MVKNVYLGEPQLGRCTSHCAFQQSRQLPWKSWFRLGKDPSQGESNAAFTQLLWRSHRKSYRSSVLPFNLLTVLQRMPKLPSVLHFSFQKLLPSTEWELRVCAGIHFEKVIWRTAWEPESLCELLSLGQSFLGSQKCSCITAHRSWSRCSGVVNQCVATAVRADVCCKLHLIQRDEHRHTVQLMHR